MKRYLFLCSAAAIAIAGVAEAQPRDRNVPQEYTPDNVVPENPFGEIDVTDAGESVEDVYAFASRLDGSQLIELLRRCQVIHPLTVTVQMLVDVDTQQGDEGAPADGAAGDVAGDNEPPPTPAGDLAGGADVYYETEHVSLCTNLQGIILAVDVTDPMDMEAD